MPKSGCSHCKHSNDTRVVKEVPNKMENLKKQINIKNSPHSKSRQTIKKSSSSFLNRHNNLCMCQVCTCHKAKHKCPINYIKKGFNGITDYQREYIPHRLEKADIYIAKDNLKSKKQFMNGTGTEYNNAYNKRNDQPENPEKREHEERVKEMILNNNQRSHIKDLMGKNRHKSGKNLERVKSANLNKNNNTSHFYQPTRFVRPNQRIVERPKMEGKTVYQNDYPAYDNNPILNYDHKINYDNLIVGNPDFRFKGTTEYRDNHNTPKNHAQNNKNQNDYIYGLIKNTNNMTHALNGDYRNPTQTEYQRNYTKKNINIDTCPMHKLPKVDSELRNMPHHVYFNKNKKDWVLN